MVKIEKLKLKSEKQFELIDITEKVAAAVKSSKLDGGVVTVFVPHTTASIRITQNEPLLRQDIMKMIYRLVPVDMNYSHDLFEIRSGTEIGERSNGHAHVKSFLLGASESVPFENRQLLLGVRQSIFFIELDGGRDRDVIIQMTGE